MWSFQYKHGDRPLEGFTIQRAAGRGGFGEVYYALSDSGREVALKVVQGYEQIELRGISQCMNLKSPHLVTIFDVKYNDQGRPFVIMEFVNGPNLRQLLDDSPAGLGTQKSAFFLREIGKGLTFLHDCGIVHRDLKPANIFFENGYVKIGDYGLSKAISPNQHSGQTVTVGTVHYMAPEVGVGKYDRSIDIYALGAVLYELLTGTVPFIGASPSEILMKHLSADPDMSGVPEPFNTVIRKAMAKNPAERYQSVQEMVEAVFGAEHVRMSMSHFSPDDLSMVAGRVAQKVAMGGGGSSSVVGSGDAAAPVSDRMGSFIPPFQGKFDPFRAVFDPIRHIGNTIGCRIDPLASQQNGQAVNDSLPRKTRQLLGFTTACVVAVAVGIMGANSSHALEQMLFVFTAICGATIGLLVAWQPWQPIESLWLRNESRTMQRLVVGGIVAAVMILCSGIFWLALPSYLSRGGTWIAILAPLTFMNTSKWTSPTRKERVTLGCAIGAAFIGYILCEIFDANSDALLPIAVLAGTVLAAQVASPWDPTLRARNVAGAKTPSAPSDKKMHIYGNITVDPKEAEAMRAAGAQVYGNMHVREPAAPIAPPVEPLSQAYSDAIGLAGYQLVPRFAASLWLGGFVVLLTVGLMCLIGVASDAIQNREAPIFVSFGIMACVSAIFCFIRIFARRFYGWWSYLIRPGMMLACINAILMSSIILGNEDHLRSYDQMLCAFFIVFPAILFFVLPFLPRTLVTSRPQPLAGSTSPHKRTVAIGLSALFCCGLGGIQRFYVGKIGSGIFYLLTGGGFLIGQIIDVIMICTGNFTDAEGRVLRIWNDEQPIPAGGSSFMPPSATPPPLPSAAPPSPSTDSNAAAPSVNPPSPAAADRWAGVWNNRVANRSTDLVRRSSQSGGLASVFATLLTVAAILTALAIGLDLPRAVATDLPNATVAHNIRATFFADYANSLEQWVDLARQLLWGAAVLLAVMAAGFTMLARRSTTLPHVIRGLIGVGGLLCAVCLLTTPFDGQAVWFNVAKGIKFHQTGPAVQTLIDSLRTSELKMSIAAWIISCLILSMPYHRRSVAEKGSQ